MSKIVYMDNAATTAVKPEVLTAMMPFFNESYGNASSVYSLGQKSKEYLDNARLRIANCIGAKQNEVFFTSCGSEADNWAIKGVAFANEKKGKHIITSKIEHHAVLHTCEYLEKKGFEVTYLDVDKFGKINLEQLEKEIREDTILISIMFANNEVGTIQDIKQIGSIAKKHKVIFHTDAVQAFGSVDIKVSDFNIDLLSFSAHKIGGPKGVGFMYKRRGIKCESLIHGGAQEMNKRAGTENLAFIEGMAVALESAYANLESHNEYLIKLRDYFINKLTNSIDYIQLNGHPTDRLPGNVNMSIHFVEGEGLLLSLDMENIAASSGSACTSGSLDPSHVLLSMGITHEIAHGSLRFSLSTENTYEEVDFVVEKLIEIVSRLREMSPLYEQVEK